jgi:hypothetical protein
LIPTKQCFGSGFTEPGPGVLVNPDPDPGFDDRNSEKLQLKNKIFGRKIFLYLGLHDGLPSKRKSQVKGHPALHNVNFSFCGSYLPS